MEPWATVLLLISVLALSVNYMKKLNFSTIPISVYRYSVHKYFLSTIPIMQIKHLPEYFYT